MLRRLLVRVRKPDQSGLAERWAGERDAVRRQLRIEAVGERRPRREANRVEVVSGTWFEVRARVLDVEAARLREIEILRAIGAIPQRCVTCRWRYL